MSDTAGVQQSACPVRVVFAHPSPDLYGSDRMLLESVRAVSERGWDVVVTLPDHGPLVPGLQALGARVVIAETVVLRRGHLSVRGLSGLAVRALRSLPVMVSLLRREHADLLYVNTVTIPLWLVAGRLGRLPVVVHVHEAEDRGSRLVRTGLHLPLLLARSVLVNSSSTSRAVASAVPALAARVRIIHNGVRLRAGSTALPDRAPLRLRLVLVGRLSPVKGTDLALQCLLRLVERGHDAVLSLVGDVYPGYEWFREQLEREASAPPLSGRVDFVGFVQDVAPFLDAADVTLVPSRKEALGNVAVEAALAGRPVVAARVQGLSEVVDDGRTGLLVAPEDPAALADGVERLVSDWEGARRMADLAREDAHRHFGAQRYSDELVSALAQQLPESRSAWRPPAAAGS